MGRLRYDDFFRKPDTRKIPYKDRGLEYARYIRRLRTMLEWSRQRGIEMEVKIGDADRAEEYIRKKGLDMDDPMSWAEAAKVYDVMPYVVYEIEDYNTYVAGEVRAAVNMLSYYPDVSGRIDCIAAEIYTKDEVVCTVKAWLNPLYEGETAYEAAIRNISQYFEKYGVKRAVMPEFSVPYDSCPDCGQLGITRVRDEWGV